MDGKASHNSNSRILTTDDGIGEILMVLDLIQGLSLLHYDSKQIAGHQQRIDVS